MNPSPLKIGYHHLIQFPRVSMGFPQLLGWNITDKGDSKSTWVGRLCRWEHHLIFPTGHRPAGKGTNQILVNPDKGGWVLKKIECCITLPPFWADDDDIFMWVNHDSTTSWHFINMHGLACSLVRLFTPLLKFSFHTQTHQTYRGVIWNRGLSTTPLHAYCLLTSGM